MTKQESGYEGPKYLLFSEQLLDPEVEAVELGLLETGKFTDIYEKMVELAKERGIRTPKMVVDLPIREEMRLKPDSSGQLYPITEEEWELFVKDVPVYCNGVPKVYMVDGSKYTIGI